MRWDLVASTLVYAGQRSSPGSHFFLRWLYREMCRDSGSTEPTAAGPWRLSSTLRIFTLILLMLVVGMAAIGVVHQTGWLVNSPEPIFQYFSYENRNRARCAKNLEAIAQRFRTTPGIMRDVIQPIFRHS